MLTRAGNWGFVHVLILVLQRKGIDNVTELMSSELLIIVLNKQYIGLYLVSIMWKRLTKCWTLNTEICSFTYKSQHDTCYLLVIPLLQQVQLTCLLIEQTIYDWHSFLFFSIANWFYAWSHIVLTNCRGLKTNYLVSFRLVGLYCYWLYMRHC